MFDIKAAVKQFNNALVEAQRKVEESKNSLAFYEDRVEKLTKAVATINETLSDNDLLSEDTPKTRKPREKHDIPETDSNFWISHVTSEFKSASDILATATNSLNVTDKKQINLLKMRQNFHLVRLTSQGKIKTDGKGRSKTYALAA